MRRRRDFIIKALNYLIMALLLLLFLAPFAIALINFLILAAMARDEIANPLREPAIPAA